MTRLDDALDLSGSTPSDLALARPQRHVARQPVKTHPIITDMGALASLQHLPGGLIGDREFVRLHGIPPMTLRDAVKDGRVPRAEGGPWRVPGRTITYMLNAKGQAMAYRLFVRGFDDRERTCCPHELPTDPEPETPAGSPRELVSTLPRASSAWRIPTGDDDAGDDEQ